MSDINLNVQEAIHKEIDLIQAVISRMAQNSFMIKGWCITVISALFAVGEIKGVELLPFFLALACVAFWFVDSQYLRYERLFRKLYENVIKKRNAGDVDGMYELDVSPFQGKVPCVFALMFTRTECPLYAVLLLVLLALGMAGYGMNDAANVYEVDVNLKEDRHRCCEICPACHEDLDVTGGL